MSPRSTETDFNHDWKSTKQDYSPSNIGQTPVNNAFDDSPTDSETDPPPGYGFGV